jgi:membrane-associated phospholipid phosphatase
MGFSRTNLLACGFCLVALYNSVFSQKIDIPLKTYKVSITSPYNLDVKKDIIIGASAATISTLAEIIKLNNSPITLQDIDSTDISIVPLFDLRGIHQYNHSLLVASDVMLYTSALLPFISFADKRVSGHAPQIILMYFETLAINFAAYSMTTALLPRRRPLTFNTDSVDGQPKVPQGSKTGRNVNDSFFSGHTSTAAAACFFGARIFTDLRPQSKLVPFVWAAGTIVPAFVGYARYRAGKHFPTDVITAYIVGGTIGFMVPTVHKLKKSENLTLFPTSNGLGMVYRF